MNNLNIPIVCLLVYSTKALRKPFGPSFSLVFWNLTSFLLNINAANSPETIPMIIAARYANIPNLGDMEPEISIKLVTLIMGEETLNAITTPMEIPEARRISRIGISLQEHIGIVAPITAAPKTDTGVPPGIFFNMEPICFSVTKARIKDDAMMPNRSHGTVFRKMLKELANAWINRFTTVFPIHTSCKSHPPPWKGGIQ